MVPIPFSSSLSPPTVSFSYNPKFIIIGDSINFTQKITGGTPPYTFSWSFGDRTLGSGPTVLHTYTVANTYTVTLNVTDSLSQFNSISEPVTVNEWPVSSLGLGWVVPWNLTQTDGVNIWNVTYHGTIIIRDARLAAIQDLYLRNFCGPFYNEAYNMTGVKADGNISYFQNSTDQSNPYFQLTAEYPSGGYDFTEAFRFYKNGTWEPTLIIRRGGCAAIHVYELHWRVDLALTEDTNNYMSAYTPEGTWLDLLWEGNYTDNGFRDQAHNGAIWRYADQGRYYYIAPVISRADLDLPSLPSDLVLVRGHPNEIEVSHSALQVESPVEWVNGEPTFRKDIAFWWVPKVYEHGPIPGVSLNATIIALAFYPAGRWA